MGIGSARQRLRGGAKRRRKGRRKKGEGGKKGGWGVEQGLKEDTDCHRAQQGVAEL